MSVDYYKVLGVTKTATAEDIKKSYKKLAMLWHPDRTTTNKKTATDKFKQIAEAYSILIDPVKRKTYDLYGKKGLSTQGNYEQFDKQKAQNLFDQFMKSMNTKTQGPPPFFGGQVPVGTTTSSSIQVNVNGKDVDPSELKKMGIDLSTLGVVGGFDFGAHFGGKPGQVNTNSNTTVNTTTTTYDHTGKIINTSSGTGINTGGTTTNSTNFVNTGTSTNFGSSFGSNFGNGFGNTSQSDTSESTEFDLELQLREFYEGTIRKIRINRNVVCKDCDGTGSKSKTPTSRCLYCNGKGFQVVCKRVGDKQEKQPAPCLTCFGLCTDVDPEDKCQKCNGMRTVREFKKLKITVKPGTRSGGKLTFEGLGDEIPGKKTGDLIVTLKEQPHEIFIRKGNDLVCTRIISIQESLCGYDIKIPFIDGTEKTIKSEPDEVTRHGYRKRIEGLGFPWPMSPEDRGCLVVEFEVQFPKTLPVDIKDQLRPLLESTKIVEDKRFFPF